MDRRQEQRGQKEKPKIIDRLTKVDKAHLYGAARHIELPADLLQFNASVSGETDRDLRSSFSFWQSLFRQLNAMGFLHTSPTTLRTSIGKRGYEFMDKYHGVGGSTAEVEQTPYLPMRKLFADLPEKIAKIKNPLERRGRPRKVVATDEGVLGGLESVANAETAVLNE